METKEDTADQVNKVVDNLVEKLGVAGDKLEPLAEIVVQEYMRAHLAGAILSVITVIVGFVVMKKIIKNLNNGDKTAETEMINIFGCVGISVAIIFGIFFTISETMHCLAPHYYLLKELLR